MYCIHILSSSDLDMKQEQSKHEGNALAFVCKTSRCNKNLQLDFTEYIV